MFSLCATLALVVAGARPDRVDVAAIILGLRMHHGIAIDLARGGLEDLGFDALGQAQHVDRAMHAGLCRLHRIELVMHGRGRAGEVVDLVHLHIEREGHVVTEHLEMRVPQKVDDIVLGSGEIVVDAEHVGACAEQPLAQMRAEESGAARHQHPFAKHVPDLSFKISFCARRR
jgi:hypothetical protein